MAKNGYIGVEGNAKKIGKYFVGVDGTARKVTKAYVGDALGKARLFFEAHTHSFDIYRGYDSDDTEHWQVYECACGSQDKSNYANHYKRSGPHYKNYNYNTSQHYKYYSCICGKWVSSGYVTHSFSSQGTIAGSDSTGHWYNTKCVCGKTGVSASEAHNGWVESIISTATCVSNGKKSVKCGKCDYSYLETIPATGNHKADEYGYCLMCGQKVGPTIEDIM
jgi:hypothetical protein